MSDARPPREAWPLVVAGVVIILCLRLVALTQFPPPVADEGTWPFPVRQMVVDHVLHPNYYTAPAYHWLLGLVFRLFGPVLAVGRITAALIGLLSLGQVYAISMRAFHDRNIALVAVLILGTDVSASLVGRTALIEPYHIAWLLALIYFLLGNRLTDLIGVSLCTAALMLTKLNAIYVVPVAILAVLWNLRQPGVSPRPRALLFMALGLVLAASVYWYLYRSDPTTFMKGWQQKLLVDPSGGVTADPMSLVSSRRFIVKPHGVLLKLRALAGDAPLLFAFGVAAAFKALTERRNALLGWWTLGALSFLLLTLYVQDTWFALASPPLAIGAAWLLAEIPATGWKRRWLGLPISWPTLTIAVMVGAAVLQLSARLAWTRPSTADAVSWLQARVKREETVLGAPYILMQLTSKSIPFQEFRPSFVPGCDQVLGRRVRWVIVDEKEWGGRAGRGGRSTADIGQNLAPCSRPVKRTPGATVYEVLPNRESPP